LATSIKGLSTISCPIHPKQSEVKKNIQNSLRYTGFQKPLRWLLVSKLGRKSKIAIAIPIKATPPNLSGIARKTA
jgi:hypothetical protein